MKQVLSIIFALAVICSPVRTTLATANLVFDERLMSDIGGVSGQEPEDRIGAELNSFTATQTDEGTILEWRTGFELSTLGFNLYREESGQRTLITPSLIAGSALFVGPRTALSAGQPYLWRDPQGRPGAQYWLEEIDLNGTHTWHGPIAAVAGTPGRQAPKRPQSSLLSQPDSSTQGPAQAAQREWPAPVSVVKRRLKWESTAPPRSGSFFRPSATGPGKRQALDQQRALAAQPSLKISVRQNGWYRITQGELAAAGFDPSADPRTLQLFTDGVEVPLSVSSASQSRLEPGDYLEFYGLGLDTPTTDTRVYWLTAGPGSGKRVQVATNQASASTGMAQNFLLTIERKEHVVYFSSLLNGEAENFFGPIVFANPVAQSLSVHHLDQAAAGQAVLEVALQGVTYGNHQVKVKVNDVEEGTVSFAGRDHNVTQFPVTLSTLREGDNTITLATTGLQSDASVIDYVRLTYPHTYQADNNALGFTLTGSQPARVDGFTSSRIRVLDITDPSAVQELKTEAQSQAGGYAITLQVPGPRTLLALAEEQIAHPVAMAINQPSAWYRYEPGADLVIITHRDFRQSVEPLRTLRERQGYQVAVVDVEDLYDEFSFGTHTPQAIKDFLARAKAAWPRAPRFVLLVGDSSLDPKNYTGHGELDFVPTKLIDTAYLETASDDWFVDFDRDGLPDLAVGRLPARMSAEATAMISKIVAYPETEAMRGALFVNDQLNLFDFEAEGHYLTTLLPRAMPVHTINRRDEPAESLRSKIIDGINHGPLLVNYLGHGSVDIWTGAGLLRDSDVSSLTNNEPASLFVMMTCLNGYFQDPALECLGETLLKTPNGGGVAIFTSTGMTVPDAQAQMNEELYRLLFSDRSLTVGEAVARAKAATEDLDVRRTFILLGDPTMRLPSPLYNTAPARPSNRGADKAGSLGRSLSFLKSLIY